jgi:hypothetical protein
MQRVGTLFLIYLFLLACISWIPAPYRLKEQFYTGFYMAPLTQTPGDADTEANTEAEAEAEATPVVICEIYCPDTDDDIKNMGCPHGTQCQYTALDCSTTSTPPDGSLIGICT